MTAREKLELRVRDLLKNLELKVILDAPNGDYRFEYYTKATKDIATGQILYVRTYTLCDLIRGGETQEPWGTYDLEKQIGLVTGLLDFSKYHVSKVITGWMIKCPTCGHIKEGKIWETVPKTCTGTGPPKCLQKFSDNSLVEKHAVGNQRIKGDRPL